MATIGQTLSAARVAAGYTVADLSIRTRIRESVLTGIEQEDFVPCGGDFYARGHIRGICRALGLDPAPLLSEYEREHASRAIPAFIPPQRHLTTPPETARAVVAARGATRTGENGDTVIAHRFGEDDSGDSAQRWGHFERDQILGGASEEEPEGEKRGPRAPAPRQSGEGRRDGRRAAGPRRASAGPARSRAVRGRPARGRHHAPRRGRGPGGPVGPRPAPAGAARSPVLAVRRHWPWAVVGAIVLLALFVGLRTWQDWDAGNPLRAAFDSSSSERTIDSAAGTAAEAAQEQPAEFDVELSSSGRSWVEITDAEGEDLYVGYLLEGDARDYVTEDAINMWVGDAGAINVSVNGEDLGPLGLPGEVKEVVIGPDGVTQ